MALGYEDKAPLDPREQLALFIKEKAAETTFSIEEIGEVAQAAEDMLKRANCGRAALKDICTITKNVVDMAVRAKLSALRGQVEMMI